MRLRLSRNGSPPRMIDALELWPAHEASMRLRRLSAMTVRDRRRIIERIGATVDLADVTRQDIETFLDSNPRWTASTLHTYLGHLRSFYGWAVFEDRLDVDPTFRIPITRVPGNLPRPITHADLDRALREADDRIRLWLLLGAYAGLRCAEIAALHENDVQDGLLYVRGKGQKIRTVPLHPRLLAELEAWPTRGLLFPGVRPHRLSGICNNHLRALGIRSTMHSTRHRFGTDIYATERDILVTSKLLGHASAKTTQVYAQVDQEAAARMIGRLSYG